MPAEGGRPPGDGAGTDRRRFLKYGAGAAGALILAGGGYFAYDTFVAGGASGPKATVRQFYTAASNGNVQEANSYVHPDSPTGEFSQSDLEGIEQISIRSLELVEKSGDTARVRAKLTITTDVAGEQQIEQVIELRTSGGEWKVYE